MIPAKAKEPFKTALAMVIAYGIALAMDWDKPYWAGFAVAFCSLSTIGQSFNKAAMRMFGTLVAVVVALLLIGLFPQERWLFMAALSLYVGLCTYLATGPKRQYFWLISGFVCVIICMSAGPDPVNAFDIVVLRAEETGLGILAYSLVTALLWPVSNRKDFFAVTGELASGQRQFCRAGLKRGKASDPVQALALKGQLIQAQTRFQQLLDAAESDTREVWETAIAEMKKGDQAIVTLMTYPDQPLAGTVDSLGWGIAQQDGSTGFELLPNVSPTFEWIRLAQRIPVRIELDKVPEDVALRIGTTGSVLVKTCTGDREE